MIGMHRMKAHYYLQGTFPSTSGTHDLPWRHNGPVKKLSAHNPSINTTSRFGDDATPTVRRLESLCVPDCTARSDPLAHQTTALEGTAEGFAVIDEAAQPTNAEPKQQGQQQSLDISHVCEKMPV